MAVVGLDQEPGLTPPRLKQGSRVKWRYHLAVGLAAPDDGLVLIRCETDRRSYRVPVRELTLILPAEWAQRQ
jgi:hypothetical protein